ncbi:MAG: nitroreductase [Cellvibrionaceae bacterium]|jgi:nitroreductase
MLLSYLIRLKIRLQFTGWLQYIPTAIFAILFLLIALFARFLESRWVAVPFTFVGLLLLTVLLFDLVTVKFHLHPREGLPKQNDDLAMFDLIRSRRSCRSFQGRKLTLADHESLMQAVRLHSDAPTVGKGPIRFEYAAAPLTVWPVVGATEFLVAIAPSEYNRLAIIDVGRSLQKIVIDATRIGLATCWIGPGADQASIAQQLGDRFNAKEDHIICVCAVGYRSWYKPAFLRVIQSIQRRRLPLSALFFADSSFEFPLDTDMAPFNRFGRSYEICQWSPSSFNGQTTRCVAVSEQDEVEIATAEKREPRVLRVDFYAATASRYYAAVALGIWFANWEMCCEALDIQGHLALLSAEERGARDEAAIPQLPRYDMSWVLDESV